MSNKVEVQLVAVQIRRSARSADSNGPSALEPGQEKEEGKETGGDNVEREVEVIKGEAVEDPFI